MPGGHLLEIGCASGTYLQDMRSKGWSVEGIEYSASAAESAMKLGIEVQVGSLESTAGPLHKPDLIAAWMVLEHLHEPVAALRKIRGWVADDAYLVGVVPDVDSIDRRLFGEFWYAWQLPTHLYHYSPRTLRKLLQAGGWDLVQVRWQPNERNFLISFERWLLDHRQGRPSVLFEWFKSSRSARKLRRWFAWGLGLSHQSGRMEFWARPARPGQGSGS
jgi:SAM-dependent methyltransferase